MIEAVVEFRLAYPYKKGVFIIQDLVSIWNLRLVSSSMSKGSATVVMHWKKFKDIFGMNPRVGEVDIPQKLERFVNTIVVKKVRASES